jgi:hypothetical protein
MADHVAEWIVAPIPGYEGKAIFFSDGRAEFFDEPARHRENDRGSTVRKVAFMLYEETDRHLSDEVCRYTHPFKVPLDLLDRLVATTRKLMITDEGEVVSDISNEEEMKIDAELNAIFWEQINPFLTTPLTRREAHGRTTTED